MVLGKVSNLSTLSPAECMAIQQFSVMQITTASVYHRLLKSGIVYSASSYMRSKITNDSVICFQRRGQKAFGLVQKFVSFCTDGCSSTDCSLPCQHVVIVTPYEVLYDNSRTEATARYIHHVKLSRYEMHNNIYTYKCILVLISGKLKYILQRRYLENVSTCNSPYQNQLISLKYPIMRRKTYRCNFI